MPTSRHDSPYHDAPGDDAASRRRGGRKRSTESAEKSTSHSPARKRGGRRRGSGHGHHELTSHPTSRGAYVETRVWLLKTYGPHCAYCGRKFAADVMTLDHVAPRRGQSAYDRRDNLVLACPTCNAAKKDKAPLAYLLASKRRAAHLLKYGAHLSHGLLELARPIAERHGPTAEHPATPSHAHPPRKERHRYGPAHPDEESPYRD